jgi:stearoyl-CoA desaturase (delta-9 desaturase)
VSVFIKPITYAIAHRAHHRYSDTINDPHSPAVGFWKCLIGNYNHVDVTSSVRDLVRNKEFTFIHNNFWYLYSATVVIFAAIDIQLMYLSFPFLVLRYHVQATIFNYIAHGGGSKNTGPQNLDFIPGVFFWGEHLHLNHHLRQTSANHGRVSKINFDYMYYLLNRLKLIHKE